MSERMATVRYKENPFLGEMAISTRNRRVTVRGLGKTEDVTLVNSTTGEISGTHISTYKKVDSEEFVKLFAKNVALTFDLTRAGNKALTILIWVVQYNAIEKDRVVLDSFTHEDFLDNHLDKDLKLSLATFKRGVRELEEAKIVAKTQRAGTYFINPNFIFNGDRIAFSRVIERSSDTKAVGGE